MNNVLQLAGNLQATARDIGSTHLEKQLYLLEESKQRTKVAGSGTVAADALYIKVVLDVNKHVSKHLGSNGGNINTNNADDAYSLSAINIQSTHFSDTVASAAAVNNHHYNQLAVQGQAPAATANDYWRTGVDGNGDLVGKVYYKLPQPKNAQNEVTAKQLKMGHINFKKGDTSLGAFGVFVSINIPDATENAYTVGNPTVDGNNLTGSIDDVITNAQYAYVSKSDAAAQADMGQADRVFDANFGADSRRKSDADGSAQDWIAETNVDDLEDKLSVEVEKSEVQAAYATELAALKTSLLGNAPKVLMSWSIDVTKIDADTDSLLSKFGRLAKSNSPGIDTNIFAPGDKIVVSDANNINNAKTASVDFKARELKDNGQQKGSDTTIASGNLIALLEQA